MTKPREKSRKELTDNNKLLDILSQSHISSTSLCPYFYGVIIIIGGQTKQILQEVADMIVLKILAAPFVVALTL
ncbi:MAG: hypothetical protein ACI4IU_05970, partial [Candidatus Limousia pullorum]